MILRIGQRNYVVKWKFNLRQCKCVIYFLFMSALTSEKLLENALRYETDCSLEYFAITMQEV